MVVPSYLDKVLKAISRRYERMPRKGWDFIYEKFNLNVSKEDFKKQAKSASVKCSRIEFNEETSKRKKSIVDIFEENTFYDLKLYTRVKEALAKELGNIRDCKVEDAPRTRKISSEMVDGMILGLINQAIGERITARGISTWTEVAKILQAFLFTYQELTKKNQLEKKMLSK